MPFWMRASSRCFPTPQFQMLHRRHRLRLFHGPLSAHLCFRADWGHESLEREQLVIF